MRPLARYLVAILASLTLAILFSNGNLAHAQVRANGRIVFISTRSGSTQIYTMNADGSDVRQLTTSAAPSIDPMFSPDGNKIAFARKTSAANSSYEIYVMNADGSNVTRLTNNSTQDNQPTWSPDGTKIAFTSYRDGNGTTDNQEIYVMNPDGTSQTNLTNTALGTQDFLPAWSPNGNKILFSRQQDGSTNVDVYVMDTNGSNQVNLTSNSSASDIAYSWSPDGTKIAFRSDRDGSDPVNSLEIYVMNADGSNQTRLTSNAFGDTQPDWSPDGTTIAFLSNRDGNFEVYTMNADGSNQTNISNNAANDQQPRWQTLKANGQIVFAARRDRPTTEIYTMSPSGGGVARLTNIAGGNLDPAWSPDGTKIAFRSGRDGNSEIYTMNADGSNQTRITNNAALDSQPAWSPDATKLVFATNRDGNFEIYTMDVGGTNQTRLTNNANDDTQPVFSPDGKKIAFLSARDGNFEIYTMNADGTNQTRLTNNAINDFDPAWSPDGAKLIFRSDRSGLFQIYSMNADGSNQTQLSTSSGNDSQPFFSPDGAKITFVSDRDGNLEIYTMNADGTLQTRLSNNSVDDIEPKWQSLVPTTTPTGTNVMTKSGDATLTFSNVGSSGTTTSQPISPSNAGTVPNGYTLCQGCTAYEISTTAQYTPPVTVCLDVPLSIDDQTFNSLKLLHGENGQLVDRTVSRSTNPRKVCGQVDSLSPFALAVGSSPTAAQVNITGQIRTTDGAPLGGASVTLSGTKTARAITDSQGYYRFNNLTTGGFYTLTPSRANYSFSPASQSFSLSADKTDAVFTATADSAEMKNPLDTSEYFVRQQYLDFLDREPDAGGFGYWSSQFDTCHGDASCLNQTRINVSAAFFIENEFQQTGSFIYRTYKASLGARPAYAQFSSDRSRVIGGANLETSKQSFVDEFVSRPEFKTAYPDSLGNADFVNKLFDTAELTGNEAERQSYTNMLNSGGTRSQVLRAIIESDAFKMKQYNPSFVLMQYFGYLRRDPDEAGLEFWLNVLNNREPNNYRGMVCSFITSAEYQKRFGVLLTHSNAECGQ